MNTLSRRRLLGALLILPAALALPARARPAREIEVWKDPNCGCCKDWIAHLEQHGFRAKIYPTGNSEMRAQLGMPARYGSCHTARIGGYLIEGHVPAADIVRLLDTRPAALGLAVPAMPVGSPGMDGPAYKGRKDPYDVLLIARDGSASIFRSYR